MAEVIAIVSGKGGVGKTTTSANIGTALAAMGKKVLLVDGDIGLRNLDISLGMQDKVIYHFNDIIKERCSPNSALIADERFIGLNLLSAPQSINDKKIDKQDFKDLIDKFRSSFDYIIIDCAAGLDDSFVMGASAADKAVIVATPELISIRDADQVAGKLESMGKTDLFLIINRICIDMIKKGDMIDVDAIINTVAVTLIGAVPEDKEIIVSNNKGKPVVLSRKSIAGKAFVNIAKRITGEKVPIIKDENKSIFKLFKR